MSEQVHRRGPLASRQHRSHCRFSRPYHDQSAAREWKTQYLRPLRRAQRPGNPTESVLPRLHARSHGAMALFRDACGGRNKGSRLAPGRMIYAASAASKPHLWRDFAYPALGMRLARDRQQGGFPGAGANAHCATQRCGRAGCRCARRLRPCGSQEARVWRQSARWSTKTGLQRAVLSPASSPVNTVAIAGRVAAATGTWLTKP